MATRTAYPPTHHHAHLSHTVPPSTAQSLLSTFLTLTQSSPHLHPDALLSVSGIAYSAQSGPTGGLALHHLRRIEAGLRGENLVAETADELAQFGAAESGLPEGDDAKLDALIEGKSALKRKRKEEDIEQWAEEASQSEAAYGEVTRAGAAGEDATALEDWEDKEEWEHSQRPLEGEIGNREGAPAVKQNGAPPAIKHVHSDDGHEEGGATQQKALTEEDKAARRAAKKARLKAEKKQKGMHKKGRADKG